MTSWSLERKKRASFAAPMGRDLALPDTRYVERPDWFQVITPSAPGGSRNEIYSSQVDDADAERTIDEAIATYRAIGQPVKWCVGSWTRPLDLGARLTRRGFAQWDVRSMGRETTLPLGAPADLKVERMEPDAHASPNVWFYRVGRDGDWFGTAATILRGDYAYLLGAQVNEAARGRGAYRALVATRLQALQQVGIEYAISHARESTSAPMLEHLGFETLDRYCCYVLEPETVV